MYKLLLVDDEILVREAIAGNIHWKELGYELVSTCENGKEAITYIKENKVDVVLTDVCMPFIDGIELSKYIHINNLEIDVIIFSGYNEFEYAQKAIRYGVSEYLSKPITSYELSEVLINLKKRLDKKKEIENEFKKINKSYFKNLILIQSKIIKNLIMGNELEESRKEIEEYGINIDYLSYRVAIIEIDIYSDSYNTDKDKIKQGDMKSFVIYNISNEIIKRYNAGEVCKGDNNRAFILLWTNSPREFSNIISKIFEEIQEEVFKFSELTITISIGENVYSLSDLHKSYKDAEELLLYKYLWNENQIFDREKLKNKLNASLNLDGIIDKLILSIKLNERKQIEENIFEIQELFREGYIKKDKMCLYLFEIISQTCDLLRLSNIAEEFIYKIKENSITKITESRSLSEAIVILKEFCFMSCEKMYIQKNSYSNKLAILALDYIEKNYNDYDLNLNIICSYLCISTSYFSTIFKNYTGYTFMEVLIRTRMDKAKELLENTNLKNYEISDKVGFRDPHYFSIAFKKITGKSPKEYAKEMRKN
ncbi:MULTISPECIES: response regulator [unclassified Clostridium]|uniref:response regulator n=1 Tax=unclassified Clostridium TaxID=2614128 RepID=UPI0025C2141B|nr:response regulator [Clostridium sp.]MDY4251587.1 response regulator [Clostridium sp.]MDY6227175.1 response regulator [Clostridium sp.]